MTNKELIEYTDGIMSEMVAKINRHRKNWVYIYQIEKVPYNGVRITLFLKYSQTIVHKDNTKIKTYNTIKFGNSKFYAIQDKEIMFWDIQRFFHWYFTEPVQKMTNPKKCMLLEQGKDCEYCSSKKILIDAEMKNDGDDEG